ncbi:hypothetical protein E2C01_008316 [Portunus trituberculatus]|uniref:Uncharacterized protein n=1 Tax=Portunus trituberculatus TaxID=210409 RepID=A0A5B7D0F7_PORTR|nr:hypothetical protein [Portunus trituberculatus]
MEREMRCMKELISNILEKQDKLTKESIDLKERTEECEKVREVNQVMKEEMEELKRQNGILMATCGEYEETLKCLQGKVQDGTSRVGEIKLEELRNVRKKEQEEEKLNSVR